MYLQAKTDPSASGCHCRAATYSGRQPPLLTSAILALSDPTSDVYLKAFPDSDWSDLGVLRNIQMFSLHNTKEIGNPTVRSKVMALGSVPMCFSQFSQYLNRFNSDIDP